MLVLSLEQKTWAHRIPVGWKLLVLLAATLVLFPVERLDVLMTLLGLEAILYASLGRTAFKTGLRMLSPIFVICGFILVYHLLTDRLQSGLSIVAKIVVLVGLANAVTMTSRLQDMMDVTMRLLSPLRQFGINTHAISLAFALVVRFTPVLIARGSALIEAWRARSPRRAGWRVVFPMVLLALDDADHIADALKARGGLSQN